RMKLTVPHGRHRGLRYSCSCGVRASPAAARQIAATAQRAWLREPRWRRGVAPAPSLRQACPIHPTPGEAPTMFTSPSNSCTAVEVNTSADLSVAEHAALFHRDGGDPPVRDGLRIAWSRKGAILGYAGIAATVGMILRAIEQRVGF